MNILNFFSKDKSQTFAGVKINKDGFLKILEVKKVNNSYTPIFLISENFLFFLKKDGFLNKKKFIDFFKEIKKQTESTSIKIYFENFKPKDNPIKITIKESLKIAGFGPANEEILKPNIKGIILSNNLTENENVLHFYQNNLTLLQTENGKVKHKEEFSILDLNSKKSLKIIKNLQNNTIKLSGGFGDLFRTTKNLLKACGANVEEVNIWQNILSFSDSIPQVSKKESRYIVDLLAFVVPKLRKWDYVSIKLPRENIKLTDKKPKKKKTFLPKINKNLFLPKKKKIKSLPKNKIEQKPKKQTISTEIKKLPKNKTKIFLKKRKIKTENEVGRKISQNIKKYSNLNIPFDQKSVDEKIAEYSDFDVSDLIKQNIQTQTNTEPLQKTKRTFWKKIKKILNKKVF